MTYLGYCILCSSEGTQQDKLTRDALLNHWRVTHSIEEVDEDLVLNSGIRAKRCQDCQYFYSNLVKSRGKESCQNCHRSLKSPDNEQKTNEDNQRNMNEFDTNEELDPDFERAEERVDVEVMKCFKGEWFTGKLKRIEDCGYFIIL